MNPRLTFKRSALALAIGFAAASGAFAQSNSQGYVFGQVSSGGTVTVENLGTGQKREISADADGNYRAAALPTGKYRVSFDGQSREVTVNVGSGTPVSFAAGTQLGVVEVTGENLSPIDVSSMDSTTVFTEAEIDALPIARSVNSVAALAPGTVAGDDAFSDTAGGHGNNGGLVSFGGSSVAENAFFINGFNVTNMLKGLAFSELPFEAISEQQIKTGGYGAEFGRSLGGVVNIITKRGTNDWKFGASAYFTPEALLETRRVRNNDDGTYDIIDTDGNGDGYQVNIQAGGPIVQDRLFIYGLLQADKNDRSNYFNTTVTDGKRDRPQGLVKLDWNISDNHLLELTAFQDKNEFSTDDYATTAVNSDERDLNTASTSIQETGGKNYVAKWTGYLSDNFTLSALAGQGDYSRDAGTSAAACPVAIDARVSARSIGCYNPSVATVAKSGLKDTRTAFRLDADWVLGDHSVRFGLDREDYETVDGNFYSGGEYFRYVAAVPGATLTNGAVVPTGVSELVRLRVLDNGGTFDTLMSAWYVEDRWQATDNLLLYGGIRNEAFENKNAVGGTFIDINNTWAPRLGFSWDMAGDSTRKLFGNAGRYFIPVMANTNVRLAGAETFWEEFYTFSAIDPATGAPTLGTQVGTRRNISSGTVPDPRTVVDNELDPMFQDEFIIGFEQQVMENWAVGARALHRKLGAGMDDYCSSAFPTAWALANGYDQAGAAAIGSAVGHCFLMNPGNDLDMNVDTNGDGVLERVVIPAAATGLPELSRKYNSLELFARRNWDDRWFLQGTWVIAHSYGNNEGYVRSDNGQDDAGITTSFDLPGLVEGGYGDLPNDRRHSLKIYGAYKLNDQWEFGADLLVQSGRPRNCFQVYNGTNDPEGSSYGVGSAFYCTTDRVNGSATDATLSPRGSIGRSPWTNALGLGVTYRPTFAEGVAFKLDVTNVFDQKKNYFTNEIGDEVGGDLRNSFGFPAQLQPGRSVRLGVSYDF